MCAAGVNRLIDKTSAMKQAIEDASPGQDKRSRFDPRAPAIRRFAVTASRFQGSSCLPERRPETMKSVACPVCVGRSGFGVARRLDSLPYISEKGFSRPLGVSKSFKFRVEL